jgi:hypothetical protein
LHYSKAQIDGATTLKALAGALLGLSPEDRAKLAAPAARRTGQG